MVFKYLGGRKFVLMMVTTVLFLGFGIWCVEKDIELSDAAIFIGAVVVNSGLYLHSNVKQKNGNNSGSAGS